MPAWIRRLSQQPLLQFFAAGAVIFALHALLRGPQDQDAAVTDGVAPSAGARSEAVFSRTIHIGAADLDKLRANFRLTTRRDPNPGELSDLVETFVNEEILFREGKALALDRDDVVVRRRLIEKMTVLARPAAPPAEPTRDELQAWYRLYPHRFAAPARLSFQQRFFDVKRRVDAVGDARRVLAGLHASDVDKLAAVPVQDDFALPAAMDDRSDLQIAHLYGADFLAALQRAPLGRWSGPISSAFGQHLVLVTDRHAGGLSPFEAVEKQVRADWLTVSTRGIRAAAATLLPRYTVSFSDVPQDQAAALSQSPAVAPLLNSRQGSRP